MDDKTFQAQIRAGEEALKRSQEVLDRLAEEKALQQFQNEKDDPFFNKLREASTAILDRIIEQNQPTPKAAPRSTMGENIDRLRLECGWTYDDLAQETSLDKALIWRHVNEGKGAAPRSLKFYADAFSRGLNRTVTVAEIKTSVPKLTTE